MKLRIAVLPAVIVVLGSAPIDVVAFGGSFSPTPSYDSPPYDIKPYEESLEWLGSGSSFAIMDDASTKAWGQNEYSSIIYKLGRTGAGAGDTANTMGSNLATVNWGAGRTVKQLAQKGHSTCAILDDDTLKCFGQNNYGQAGQGSSAADAADGSDIANQAAIELPTGRHAVRVSIGSYHVCVILDNNDVVCFGGCQNGGCGNELGSGDIGDEANEMGDNLHVIDFGTDRYAVHIVTFDHTEASCALLDDASVVCWGKNNNGMLGTGSSSAVGNAANTMGDNLVAVDFGTDRYCKKLAAGFDQACCILDDDSTKCWGSVSRITCLPTGTGGATSKGAASADMGDNLPAVDFGTGLYATQIAMGGNAACALLNNHKIKCWGRPDLTGQGSSTTSGCWGDDDTEVGDNWPYAEMGTGVNVRHVMAGHHHFCAYIDGDDNLKCFGQGGSGRLGYESTDSVGDGSGEMGDNLPMVDLDGTLWTVAGGWPALSA